MGVYSFYVGISISVALNTMINTGISYYCIGILRRFGVGFGSSLVANLVSAPKYNSTIRGVIFCLAFIPDEEKAGKDPHLAAASLI